MPVKLTDLQLIYGAAGARDKFEDLTVHLIRSERPDAERVRIVRGDGGIDAHDGSLADPAGVDIFQVKFFPTGIGDSQKNQIRDSFNTARDSKKFTAKSWTLCVPIDLSIDEKGWFDGWQQRQTASSTLILHPWDATKLEGLLYDLKNRGIKEEYLQHIRETHGAVEKLARNFEERVPKSVPVNLDARIQSVHGGPAYEFDAQYDVIELSFQFHVYNMGPQAVQTWHVVADFVSKDPSRIVHKATFPQLSEHRNNPFDTTILPTLFKPAYIYIGVIVRRHWPVLRQMCAALVDTTMTCRVISDTHVGKNKPVPYFEKINWDRLMEEVNVASIAAGTPRTF